MKAPIHNYALKVTLVLGLVLLAVGVAAGATIAPGVVSWWPGDGDATDIIDGNAGTLNGGVTFVPGQVGDAFSVDGNSGRFVEVPDAPNLNFGPTSPITVDLWAFRTSSAVVQHILGKRHDCGLSFQMSTTRWALILVMAWVYFSVAGQ